ncbi:GNAT family N-acetyltransferase [Vibrio coralliilyticus]|uniref:GNAT family N-acetyltransferase n=1 Tax=Vibrio coralliilyticus TaxID=190893 RepID=UPI000BAACCBC|nr:GNAT family N-acetyltransferase [Vibrio coralliilyticus]PAU40107.1 GNAT family N-acetyltransferase [Vibrio coralliilyticus]
MQIETPRLLLRPFVAEDRDITIDLLQNDAFMAYSPTGAMNACLAQQRFEQLMSKSTAFGKLAIIERATGHLIGYCGLEEYTYQQQTMLELGYRLTPEARGNGYAIEASLAVLNIAKQQGIERVLALTEPDNVPSQKILLKLGFTPIDGGYYQSMPVEYFEKIL